MEVGCSGIGENLTDTASCLSDCCEQTELRESSHTIIQA